jgi:DDE superfamily endonuclease
VSGVFSKEADVKPQHSRYWLTHDRAAAPAPLDAAVQTLWALDQAAQALHAHGAPLVRTDEKTGIQAQERAHPTRPMKPGLIERVECEYIRHGTPALLANFEVATGHILAPSVGPTRTAADVVGHVERTIALHPPATWSFMVDRLNTQQSESLVRLVASACGIEEERGIKGQAGI